MLVKHENSENTVLLSPSMTEGVDLKDTLSRFQIFAKVPYPNYGDPVIQKRMEFYPNYYNMLTGLTLAQAYGRSTRSKDDWSHSFILDKVFVGFMQKNINIMPKWFTEAIC
jgi:Rad3-related DNA helicase